MGTDVLHTIDLTASQIPCKVGARITLSPSRFWPGNEATDYVCHPVGIARENSVFPPFLVGVGLYGYHYSSNLAGVL